MSTVIKVDDRDPSITYYGVWREGGSPSEYDFSTHGASGNGSTFTFNFVGITISVFGTITGTPSNYPTSQAVYSIDDSSSITMPLPNASTTLYNQVFFTSSTLSVGLHTLTVYVVKDDYPGFPIHWFDYLAYTSVIGSPESSPTSSTATMTEGVATSSPTIAVGTAPPSSVSSSSAQSEPTGTWNTSGFTTSFVTSSAGTDTSSSPSGKVAPSSTAVIAPPSVTTKPPAPAQTTSAQQHSATSNVVQNQNGTRSSLHTVLPAVLVPLLAVGAVLLAVVIWWRRRRQRAGVELRPFMAGCTTFPSASSASIHPSLATTTPDSSEGSGYLYRNTRSSFPTSDVPEPLSSTLLLYPRQGHVRNEPNPHPDAKRASAVSYTPPEPVRRPMTVIGTEDMGSEPPPSYHG